MKPNMFAYMAHPEMREIDFHPVDRDGKAVFIIEEFRFWMMVLGFKQDEDSSGMYERAEEEGRQR